MPKSEMAAETATGLAARIRSKEISPIEVVDDVIARIEAVNPKINAVVVKGYDDAREAAKAAEKAVITGEPLGPLHGVPIVIKDNFDHKAGWVTTFGGIRALKDYVADRSCTFTDRMEKAGAIVVGKANSPVFGFRGTCDNYLFGPSHNPFDLGRNTGGSSGGSAGAVAAGLVPLAEGTDGGGSIRIPAAWCGVYGFKASFGRTPLATRPNAFANISPFIFEGPLTRTVGDAALALSVQAGFEPRDPFSIGGAFDPLGALARPIAGMRIAYTRDYGIFPVDPRVAAVADAAVKAFEDLGAHVEEVTPRITHNQRALSDVWCRFIAPQSLYAVEAFKREGIDLLRDHPADLPPELRTWIEIGRDLTVVDMLRDEVVRTEVFDAISDVFDTYDLLVSPTLPCLAVPNADDGNTIGPSEINGEAVDPLIGWCMTYLMNFTGHPAASLPAGLVDNLPVGLQIAGRRLADEDVLAASAAFEQARPWMSTYERLDL
ncbi:MAG: amidase [Hyphomicrobiales bacterium]|nr:amidase [Hyphomicrobiales bacterium]